MLKSGLGLHRTGDGAPYVALRLSQLPPTSGDRAESPAHRDLRGILSARRGWPNSDYSFRFDPDGYYVRWIDVEDQLRKP